MKLGLSLWTAAMLAVADAYIPHDIEGIRMDIGDLPVETMPDNFLRTDFGGWKFAANQPRCPLYGDNCDTDKDCEEVDPVMGPHRRVLFIKNNSPEYEHWNHKRFWAEECNYCDHDIPARKKGRRGYCRPKGTKGGISAGLTAKKIAKASLGRFSIGRREMVDELEAKPANQD